MEQIVQYKTKTLMSLCDSKRGNSDHRIAVFIESIGNRINCFFLEVSDFARLSIEVIETQGVKITIFEMIKVSLDVTTVNAFFNAI